jgi:hypothetical protein
MFLLDRVTNNQALNPIRTGVLREFVVRQDRPPLDQRVDLPEIQESFRVSFSDAARAAASENSRDVVQKARPTDEQGAAEMKLRAYQAIAAL